MTESSNPRGLRRSNRKSLKLTGNEETDREIHLALLKQKLANNDPDKDKDKVTLSDYITSDEEEKEKKGRTGKSDKEKTPRSAGKKRKSTCSPRSTKPEAKKSKKNLVQDPDPDPDPLEIEIDVESGLPVINVFSTLFKDHQEETSEEAVIEQSKKTTNKKISHNFQVIFPFGEGKSWQCPECDFW